MNAVNKNGLALLICMGLLPTLGHAITKADSAFAEGVGFYKAGRFTEATESFDKAIRRRDHPEESRAYVEKIRKETVQRITEKNLKGSDKSTWQTKYYFMNTLDNRIRVGISIQEVFDPDSINFRPGAVEALQQLVDTLGKSEKYTADVELVNEVVQDKISNSEILSQQLAAVYSFLSSASHGTLTRH